MNRKIFYSVSILLSAVIFVSCQKDLIQESPLNLIGDTFRLSKVISLDSLSPTQTDTSSIIHFEYDIQKRITRTRFFLYANLQVADIIHGDRFYNGNDTLPYKIINHSVFYPNPRTDTTFLFYNSSGKKTKDSTRYSDGYLRIYKHIPITGGFMHTIYTTHPGGVYIDTFRIIQTIQNGHIIKEDGYANNNNPPLVREYEYDNMPNPYNPLGGVSDRTYYFRQYLGLQPIDRNNINRIIKNGVEEFRFDITYQANGLPSVISSIPAPSSGLNPLIFKFYYTN